MNQFLDIIRTFFNTSFVGVNIGVAASVIGTTLVGVAVGRRVVNKFFAAAFLIKYKAKLSYYENKIRKFTISKDPKNLRTNLIKREKLRIKAAKRGLFRTPSFAHKADRVYDRYTYKNKTLTKAERLRVIRDAKLNLYKINGNIQKYHTMANKWGMANENEAARKNGYEYFQSIDLKDLSIALDSNRIFAKDQLIVKNYEKDIKAFGATTEAAERTFGFKTSPLVLEILDENNNEVFKLSDLSPRRFIDFAADGFAYLNNILEKNINVQEENANSYRVVFYDTASQRNVETIDTVVSSSSELHTLAGKFDWNFGQVKPLANYGYTSKFSEKIVEKSARFGYTEKVNNKENLNTLIYAKNLSKNLISPALERGFKSLIEENRYTDPDPEPQITTLRIDGKEVFKAKLENIDLFRVSDPVVDAYIFAMIAKRKESGIESGIVEKTTEGNRNYKVSKNGVDVYEKSYHKKTEPIDSLKDLYEKNKDKQNFFAAFMGVANEIKLGLTIQDFERMGVFFNNAEKAYILKHLSKYQNKSMQESMERFGTLDGNRNENPNYENVRSNPDGFKKAAHYQRVVKNNMEEEISTTIPKLKENFERDVISGGTKLKGIPHTVDVISEGNNSKVMFKLGATIHDSKKFKEYFFKILMEALYLVEKNRENKIEDTPVEVYISFPPKQNREPFQARFNSAFELRDEVEKLKKESGFMDMDEFKKEYQI